MWTASFGGPARGRLGWGAELFGYPATMQMHVLPVRRIRRIVEPAGARVAGSDSAPVVGPHWRGFCHFIAVG